MIKDLDNKTFTIDPTITDKARFQSVLEKIKGWQERPEYKDWKIIEPDVKEWWEAKEEAAKAPPPKEPLVAGTKEWAAAYLGGKVDRNGKWL
jgi:adenylosuccinate synthase